MKEQQVNKLGKYHVLIKIVYLDGTITEELYKSWFHSGNYLALDTYDTKLVVINILSIKYFVVSPVEETKAIIAN